jgi:hypothetical protein
MPQKRFIGKGPSMPKALRRQKAFRWQWQGKGRQSPFVGKGTLKAKAIRWRRRFDGKGPFDGKPRYFEGKAKPKAFRRQSLFERKDLLMKIKATVV